MSPDGGEEGWRPPPLEEKRQDGRGRRIRIAVLLLILLGVGAKYLQIKHEESWVPDWKERERVSVVVLVPANPNEDEKGLLKAIDRYAFLGEGKATFNGLEDWFKREYARYGDDSDLAPLWFEVTKPMQVKTLPPPPPRARDKLGFWARYEQTTAFLDWFAARREDASPQGRNVVFVLFFRPQEAPYLKDVHSVADRRSRSGFVFAPLTEDGVELAVINVAHELLHLFGASDKYDGKRCVFPHGFYEPHKQPVYPQRYAEVMAQGIPVEAGLKEGDLELFEDMRVGMETAFEIGWVGQARRDRYYAGDTSAGPPPEPESK